MKSLLRLRESNVIKHGLDLLDIYITLNLVGRYNYLKSNILQNKHENVHFAAQNDDI